MKARPFTLAGLALGGGVGVVAAAQVWWRARGDGVAVSFTGTQSTAGLAQALAVVVLVGSVLVLVLGRRGRQLLGLVLALTGAGMAVLGGLHPRPGAQTILDRVREVTLADSFALVAGGWPWVYAAAGTVVAAAAGMLVVTAPRWPGRTRRFDRPEPVPATPADADPAEVWRAMDAGADPTASPDVHDESLGDRMEGADHPRPMSQQPE